MPITPVPQVGDEWEVRRLGQRRIIKIVGNITTVLSHGTKKRYVWWKRQPKGRYSGIYLLNLMTFGTRLSTKAERDKKLKERWKKLKLR